MYKNPLNNGDLSDYNSLKNQRDYGAKVKKYEKVKLEIEPTELQKYYQYLTYKQPILDELNYIAEKLKNEDIKKQKENFEFIQKLKNQNETKLKDLSIKEKNLTTEMKNELFNEPEVIIDLMPTINTDIEMEIPPEKTLIEDLGFDLGFDINDSEGLFELSRNKEEKEKRKKEKEADIQQNIQAKKERKELEKRAKAEAKELEKKAKAEAKKAEKEAKAEAEKAKAEAEKRQLAIEKGKQIVNKSKSKGKKKK